MRVLSFIVSCAVLCCLWKDVEQAPHKREGEQPLLFVEEHNSVGYSPYAAERQVTSYFSASNSKDYEHSKLPEDIGDNVDPLVSHHYSNHLHSSDYERRSDFLKDIPQKFLHSSYSPKELLKHKSLSSFTLQNIREILKSTAELSHGDSEVRVQILPILTRLWQKTTGQELTCSVCKMAAVVFQELLALNASQDDIVTAVTKVCSLFKIETPRVCQGFCKEFAPEILTVVEKLILAPSDLCGLLLGDSCGVPYDPWGEWNVTFPSVPQPSPMPPVPPKKGSPTYRVLHLTDIHVDTEYKVGSKADCDEPLCCREGSESEATGNGADGAWKYGDYRKCDTPTWTLENLLSTLSAQKDSFDYILWTGDVPAHNVWNQSRSDQLAVIHTVVDLLLKYFPDKPVYPSLGNHESSPVNSFPPPYVKGENSISWLYEALATTWSKWLPASVLQTVKTGAYYTVSPHPGLRIISLNMNYCNNQNWWMLLNTTDPTGELAWLIQTLQKSEVVGEKVHIIGHIPPGISDCLKTWSWNYYKVVSRYQNTIASQFFGHTHYDSFAVFYDVETLKRPVNVAYVAPSVTSYSQLNMAYRFYTVDGPYRNSSYQVLDHETYYLDLKKAQNESKITWQLEYSAKAAFNMSSLYPEDWNHLIEIMKTNNSVLEKYNRFFYKSRYSGACDATCRKMRLCDARSGRSHDPSLCKDLGFESDEDYKKTLSREVKHC